MSLHKLLAPILLLSFLSTPLLAQTWIKNPANGHYYALTKSMTWKQAEAQAVKWGGHLATVRNAAENAWLYKAYGKKAHILWIGLTDEVKEGTWVWASKEVVRFTNWDRGQPDNAGGVEDYVHILGLGVGYGQSPSKWNDLGNTGNPRNSMAGIVERVKAPVFSSYVSIGLGCPTSKKLIPALSATALPVIGKGMVLDLKNAGPITPTFLLLGFTPAVPLNLKGLGAPGCTLYANPHVIRVRVTDATGSWWPKPSFPIRNDPKLLGATFYNQVFVYDPKANALKLVASNGAKATIGF